MRRETSEEEEEEAAEAVGEIEVSGTRPGEPTGETTAGIEVSSPGSALQRAASEIFISGGGGGGGGGGWDRGDRDGGRGGGWGGDGRGERGSLPTNNRWKDEPQDRYNGGGRGGGRGGDDRRGGGGGGERYSDDWTKPLPRNERMEEELFNTAHGPSGINFDR